MIFIYVFYVDVFLVQNFLMNLIILSLTTVFWKRSVKWGKLRMVAAGLFGAVLSALCLILLGNYRGTMAVMAFFIVPAMLVLAFGWPGGRQFVFCVGTSLLSAVVLNGVALAFYNLIGITTLNLYVSIVVLITAHFLVKCMLVSVRQQKRQLEVTLTGSGECVSCMGLYDSGNLLRIPETEEPVHIIAPELMSRLAGKGESDELTEETIAFRALGAGEGNLKVYRIRALDARQGNFCCHMEPAWVGCGDEALMKGKSYQIILNAAIMN